MFSLYCELLSGIGLQYLFCVLAIFTNMSATKAYGPQEAATKMNCCSIWQPGILFAYSETEG